MVVLEIKLKKMTRRCSCHTPGCKNRDAIKISRRDDVNGAPLYLCPACIGEIHAAYEAMESAEKAIENAVNDAVIRQIEEKAEENGVKIERSAQKKPAAKKKMEAE
jgi:hypothetical protein